LIAILIRVGYICMESYDKSNKDSIRTILFSGLRSSSNTTFTWKMPKGTKKLVFFGTFHTKTEKTITFFWPGSWLIFKLNYYKLFSCLRSSPDTTFTWKMPKGTKKLVFFGTFQTKTEKTWTFFWSGSWLIFKLNYTKLSEWNCHLNSKLPQQKFISVWKAIFIWAATGSFCWLLFFSTNLPNQASETNWGKSQVGFNLLGILFVLWFWNGNIFLMIWVKHRNWLRYIEF